MPTLGGLGRGWLVRTVDRPRHGEVSTLYSPMGGRIDTESLHGGEGVVHRVNSIMLCFHLCTTGSVGYRYGMV